ncbi:MAG: hypothetical protein CVU11_05355 [Bacteroidetes bacterium HGW-Bacteroidetes-6]|jgi:biotin carboxyl carrier protein|nr:MAG: hypothetical protein CVU11_05355 [Bacteroidetes bacterium HGW-Bacteroidetes-6]
MATNYVYRRDASRLFIAVRDNGKRFKIYLPVQSEPIINGNELPIQIVDNSEFNYCFSWKGKRTHCVMNGQDQNKYSVLVNGVEYKYSIESIASYLRQRLLNKSEKATADSNIVAPMPGKIIDIFVAEGDLVNAGEPLLSLEAMKMQNEILAPFNGLVRKISVQQGQSVMKDELMFEVISIDE